MATSDDQAKANQLLHSDNREILRTLTSLLESSKERDDLVRTQLADMSACVRELTAAVRKQNEQMGAVDRLRDRVEKLEEREEENLLARDAIARWSKERLVLFTVTAGAVLGAFWNILRGSGS